MHQLNSRANTLVCLPASETTLAPHESSTVERPGSAIHQLDRRSLEQQELARSHHCRASFRLGRVGQPLFKV